MTLETYIEEDSSLCSLCSICFLKHLFMIETQWWGLAVRFARLLLNYARTSSLKKTKRLPFEGYWWVLQASSYFCWCFADYMCCCLDHDRFIHNLLIDLHDTYRPINLHGSSPLDPCANTKEHLKEVFFWHSPLFLVCGLTLSLACLLGLVSCTGCKHVLCMRWTTNYDLSIITTYIIWANPCSGKEVVWQAQWGAKRMIWRTSYVPNWSLCSFLQFLEFACNSL